MAKIYGPHDDEINLPMATQVGFINQRSAPEMRTKLDNLMALPKDDTPLLVFDNHDNERSWDRYGKGLDTAQRMQVAKVIAATLLAPRGSALMYFGQEIGMQTTPPTRLEDVKDPIGRTGWPKEKGRDGERTPMQWDESKDAGFSTADNTWLPVPPTYKEFNVAHEERDPNSILSFYKALLQLRRENAELREGDYRAIDQQSRTVLAFVRGRPGPGAVVVALNYTEKSASVSYRELGAHAKSLLSTFAEPGKVEDLKHLTVPPFGVFIGEVQ
jgi:alpha-glucosidase